MHRHMSLAEFTEVPLLIPLFWLENWMIRCVLQKVTWQSKPWGWSCLLELSLTGCHPAVWNEKFSKLYKQQRIETWRQGRNLDWRGREQGCKIRHWHVFHFQQLLGSPLLTLPKKGLEVFHACVVALFQLVLVSLLVLLDKLTVPFQGISRFLQKVLAEYGLLETLFGIYCDTLKQSLSLFSCLLGTLPSKSSCKKTRAISMGPCKRRG